MEIKTLRDALATECVLADRNVVLTAAIDPAEPEHAVLCFDAPVIWMKVDYSDISRFIEQLEFVRKHMRRMA